MRSTRTGNPNQLTLPYFLIPALKLILSFVWLRPSLGPNLAFWREVDSHIPSMATLHTICHRGFGQTRRPAQAVRHGSSSVNGVQTHLWPVEQAISRINDLDQTDAM